MEIIDILNKPDFTQQDIVQLLKAEGEEKQLLFNKAAEIRRQEIGDVVYYRGLIEFSNICAKNCYYCGIRKDNTIVNRYNISNEDILKAAEFAYQSNYGSVVLQGGELQSNSFTDRIENLCREIKKLSNNELGITLSCGEQSLKTYQRWFDAGVHRYLLRIETSNPEFYKSIHPDNELHSFENRLECLSNLKSIGYQTGTGVMVSLPDQSFEDMANDLLFMQQFDIDMVGMGPYIEHEDTPLYEKRSTLLPLQERFELTLKMIAILRIMMKDINIAAATALQAIDKLGREKAIKAGANIIMPNITPGLYRNDYALYQNKPCTDENAEDCKSCLEVRVGLTDNVIGYGKWGDSKHYKKRREV